jgi:hypothetical protein
LQQQHQQQQKERDLPQKKRKRPCEVEIVLSRPWYRVGSTVVGTVRIVRNQEEFGSGDGGNQSPLGSLRNMLGSVEIQAVGRCRLDPRWHNVPRSLRHLKDQLPAAIKTVDNDDAPPPTASNNSDPNIFCFFATEPLELLDLRERPFGAWEAVRPNRPIRLPSLLEDGTHDGDDEHDGNDDGDEGLSTEENAESSSAAASSSSSPSTTSASNDVVTSLDPNKQLLFTFRIDLDHDDMPHSLSGSTCRLFYSIVLSVTAAASPSNRTTWKELIEVPLEVRTRDPDLVEPSDDEDSSRLAISRFMASASTIRAVAHSTGLPGAITSLELNQWGGQLTVNRHGCSMFRNVRNRLQTFRIADPSGSPVCVLTTMGLTPLCPGSRFILKFDFPIHHHHHHHNPATAESAELPWVPCYQVSACVQGEEAAVRVGYGSDSRARQRAKSTIYDVAHEPVDPDCSERVCLHLVLPPDAPCTIDSDLVCISTWCTIDVAVGAATTAKNKKSGGGGGDDGYQNLRLEIPIRVVHPVAAYERRDEEGEDPRRTTPEIDDLMGYRAVSDDGNDDGLDYRDAITFRRKDIAEELKILSLVVADRCGLRPKPPRRPANDL